MQPPLPSEPALPNFIERGIGAVKRWFTEGNVPVKIGMLVLLAGVVLLFVRPVLGILGLLLGGSLAFCGLYLARLDGAGQPVPARHPALDQDPAPLEESAPLEDSQPRPASSDARAQDPEPEAAADAAGPDSPGEGYDWAPQRAPRRAARETEGS